VANFSTRSAIRDELGVFFGSWGVERLCRKDVVVSARYLSANSSVSFFAI
jgi:hypothetical protein